MKSKTLFALYLIICFFAISPFLQVVSFQSQNSSHINLVSSKESKKDSKFLFEEFHRNFDSKIKKGFNPLTSSYEINRVLEPLDNFYVLNTDLSGYDNITAFFLFFNW